MWDWQSSNFFYSFFINFKYIIINIILGKKIHNEISLKKSDEINNTTKEFLEEKNKSNLF